MATNFPYNPDTDPDLGDTPDPTAPTPPSDPFRAPTARTTTLNVPANVLDWILEAAGDPSDLDYVPAQILAAVLYQHSRWTGLDPEVVADVAQALRDTYDEGIRRASQAEDAGERGARRRGDPNQWLDAATAYRYGGYDKARTGSALTYRKELAGLTSRAAVQGPDRAAPKGKYRTTPFPGVPSRTVYPEGAARAKPVDLDDAYSLIESYFGREPHDDAEAQRLVGMSVDAARARLRSDPEGQFWRQWGPKIKTARRWLDGLSTDYLGKTLDNDEVRKVIEGGYTPQTYEQHLRAQPYGGGTLGTFFDVRQLAQKYARSELGQDADPGTVAFMVAHGITTEEQVSALYEQLRERRDTGDPNFAWVGDPETWRAMRTQVDSLWKAAGLTGKVDPHFINAAVAGKWTREDIVREIDATPAPGFDSGVTVGAVNRIRKIAGPYKDTISSVVAGEDLTTDEIKLFLTLGLNAAGIRDYYRSLPARARGPVAGATSGQAQAATSAPTPASALSAPAGGGGAPQTTPRQSPDTQDLIKRQTDPSLQKSVNDAQRIWGPGQGSYADPWLDRPEGEPREGRV